MEPDSDGQEFIWAQILTITQTLLKLMVDLLAQDLPRNPRPYHTSVLSGEGWIIELILGHLDRIWCELGMSAYTFRDITMELQRHGHKASDRVTLEEQLAIFLYTCDTGLSIRHVGERFQRSNDMISRCVVQSSLHSISDCSLHRYFRKMVAIFSSQPFYSQYISLSSSTAVHPAINNYRFMPYFKDAIGAIDGSHIPTAPPRHENIPHIGIARGPCLKTAYLCVILACNSLTH